MILRCLTRIGVAGVLVAGALGAAATPALAADVDFGLELAGSTIAADAIGKWPRIHITNHGTTRPASVVVLFDITKLDPAKVAADAGPDCPTENGVVSCTLEDDDVPAPGGALRMTIPLLRVDGATGAAGKLTVTVKVEGDTVDANDSRTVDVAIGDHGADISVYAQDVTWQEEGGGFTDEPVPPGQIAPLMALIVNQGDLIASGIRVRVRLPAQTTFTERQYTGCVLSGDRRTADCELTQFGLRPRSEPESPTGSFGMFFSFQVRVSPDAKGPVALKGGMVTASAIDQFGVSAAQRSPTAELPDYVSWATAAQLAMIDADPTDNTDEFVVFAGAPEGDDGDGGNGDGDGGDGDGGTGDGGTGGGQGGGLPVTGPTAFVLGGAGLTAVALGLMLVLVSRRRRVVVVAPGDE